MDKQGRLSRRRYLELIGVSSLSGLAGCGEQLEPQTSNPSETSDRWDIDPLEQDKLVGAHYYPWYWGDDGYGQHKERAWLSHTPYRPELGQYDSRETEVINQHIAWAVENGINWFLLNTGVPRSSKGKVIENSYLEAELSDQIHWSIGTGLNVLPVEDEEGRKVIDDPENIEIIERGFSRFEEEWFDHPNYLHIDGRPAVFDFTANRYTGDIAAGFDAAMDGLATRPYMIANPPAIWYPEIETPEDVFAAYDAVKTYIDLPWPDVIDDQDYVRHWDTMAERWRLLTDQHDLSYIPGVTPGFDDTEIQWEGRTHHDVLDLTIDEFGELCDSALKYVDDSGPNAVIVTSWNEFPEGTPIEPAEEYGYTRLQTVKEHLGQPEANSIDVGAYPLLELEFNRTVTTGGDDRSLAFFLTRLELHDDTGEVRFYDVGNYPEEPVFVDGAFHPAKGQGVTGRWLGGEEERSSLYIHPDTAGATEAVLSGWPVGNQEIAADVYLNGERTDQVRFEPGGHAEYSVSLVE